MNIYIIIDIHGYSLLDLPGDHFALVDEDIIRCLKQKYMKHRYINDT